MKDAHASGKFNATPHQWDTLLTAVRAETNVAAVTESRTAGIGKRETNIVTEASWVERDSGIATIPTPTWKRGSLHQNGVDLIWSLVEHPGRWSLLRVAAHLPAHLYVPSQRQAHKAATSALVTTLLDLREKAGADEVTLSADFNTDLRIARNRAALESHGFKVVAPKTGTHGVRVIDGFLTTLRGEARTLPKMAGFDHRAVVADLRRADEERVK